MVLTHSTSRRARSTIRAGDLRTKREIAGRFLVSGSPRVIIAACALAVVARLVVGGFSPAEVALPVVIAVLVGPVEWVIHLFLLHAPTDSFRMRKLGTGVGHREHHLDPEHMGWLLLSPVDAAVFAVMIAGFTATWSLPVLLLLGAAGAEVSLLAGYLTALVLAYLALAHYEWVHLLVHTRYRARSRYYRRLTRNHRLHHFRNEGYWLGVTSNLGDRIMRTYPAHKSDVPLSETARTLS